MRDYLGIFKELNARGIKYLVVGGTAINLYGIPRMTYDLDERGRGLEHSSHRHYRYP